MPSVLSKKRVFQAYKQCCGCRCRQLTNLATELRLQSREDRAVVQHYQVLVHHRINSEKAANANTNANCLGHGNSLSVELSLIHSVSINRCVANLGDVVPNLLVLPTGHTQ